MSLFDSLYSIGIVRKTLWRMWYPFFTKQLRGEEVLFLNYAYESEPPMGIALLGEVDCAASAQVSAQRGA